jgi:hypothetical protein
LLSFLPACCWFLMGLGSRGQLIRLLLSSFHGLNLREQRLMEMGCPGLSRQ